HSASSAMRSGSVTVTHCIIMVLASSCVGLGLSLPLTSLTNQSKNSVAVSHSSSGQLPDAASAKRSSIIILDNCLVVPQRHSGQFLQQSKWALHRGSEATC